MRRHSEVFLVHSNAAYAPQPNVLGNSGCDLSQTNVVAAHPRPSLPPRESSWNLEGVHDRPRNVEMDYISYVLDVYPASQPLSANDEVGVTVSERDKRLLGRFAMVWLNLEFLGNELAIGGGSTVHNTSTFLANVGIVEGESIEGEIFGRKLTNFICKLLRPVSSRFDTLSKHLCHVRSILLGATDELGDVHFNDPTRILMELLDVAEMVRSLRGRLSRRARVAFNASLLSVRVVAEFADIVRFRRDVNDMGRVSELCGLLNC